MMSTQCLKNVNFYVAEIEKEMVGDGRSRSDVAILKLFCSSALEVRANREFKIIIVSNHPVRD